jgi:hypothetical protein
MDHVFKRGQIHQKAFGRSPQRHNSGVRFYRYRRDADPSPLLKRGHLKPHRSRCWLAAKPDPAFDTKCADICAVYQAAPSAAEQGV